MKIIALNQQDANDLLGLITSDGLAIKASKAARVHQLQALLSTEPREECEVCKLHEVRDRFTIPLAEASVQQLEAELALRSEPT
jgi:hypothetical protein